MFKLLIIEKCDSKKAEKRAKMWNYTIKKQIKNDSISNWCEKVVKKLKKF